MQHWKQNVKKLKRETYALYYVTRDSRVPWQVRLLAACVVSYAFCPIDLIPDFIPVLGYLDDMILIPLGIALVLKLIPKAVMEEARQRAEAAIAAGQGKPRSRMAAAVIVCIWLLIGMLVVVLIVHLIRQS